ncbi:helix-turn-helix domain-containing protein [Sporosarcina limicola]|uniref:DNA-binding transcriptional ArsR family regulator n=1 Tax=Sporosarcina limicola TaxID=34101 RepID=A0A927MR50_9BACL|nr:helix-turn-helix domain-containing protein [Sporosarcina limicola]MBE1555969.1 DNA-binding transcriptional ArsR family regulator [Sporosarcina limicola]
MANKAEVLMHPVRMKISQVLMRNKEFGLTPLEMVKIIEDVPQATLYRHIQILLEAGIIRISKEKKVRSVSEKYYVLNEEEMKLSSDEWKEYSTKEKLGYISFYQLSLFTQYQNYLTKLETQACTEDKATFSLGDLKLDDNDFEKFQNELKDLLMKYYTNTAKIDEADTHYRTVAITIIPES